ncbi:unnamed protein product [Leuciscus chuanchicus]
MVFQDSTTKEDFLTLLHLKDRTRGEDIFNEFKKYVDENCIPIHKLVAITTDGAPAMRGVRSGFIALCRNDHAFPDIVNYHCVIHQQALVGKVVDFSHVMTLVVKLINSIRAKALQHRLFKALLDELDAAYGDLIFHAAGFLTDLTAKLNALNTEIQGKNCPLSHISAVNAFKAKLGFWTTHLNGRRLTHFPDLEKMSQTVKDKDAFQPEQYCAHLDKVATEFNRRFGTVEQTFGLVRFWTENEEKFTKKCFASKLLWEKAVKDLGLEACRHRRGSSRAYWLLCGNCSSLSSEAWRDARPNQGTSRPLRHVPPKWAWSRPINTARRQLLSDFSSFKRSTRIAGAGEEAAPSEREHLQRDESLKSLAAPPSCLPAALSGAYILSFTLYSVCVCDTHSKRASVFFKMPSCGSCRATLSDRDRHVVCVSCLGEEHAVLALADGGCPHCELMTMATLRTRLAFFGTAPPPAAVSRRKKRRAQRVPEPPPSRQSSPVRPLASPASSASLPDGQRPPSAAASVDIADEEALLGEDDSCSILASGSEDWAGSEDPAPPARTSSGKRASIETELMRVLAQAAASLGLEWSSPEQPAHNRLDGFFLPGERASPASRPAPFLPELHEEVAKSWSAPYSARVRPAVSLAFSAVDDAKNKGYLSLPPVEEAIAAHLCPPSAGRRAKSALPSKACRTTSSLLRRAFSAAGQAASALHTMATLQIFQADLLRKLDEEGPDAICVPDLRSATDLALRATKSAAQAIGRNMASLTVTERHLWLTLSEMAESERTAFLDAPLSATGLFGSSVKDIGERFAEVQKASQAMKHFLPKRSSSAAGRAKPSAQSSQPPSTASTSQRHQARSARPRSRSSGRHPAVRGPRPRITVKPEAPKSS